MSNINGTCFIAPRLHRNAQCGLRVPHASLQGQYPRILGVMVQLNTVQLASKLIVAPVLCLVLSLQFLSTFVFLVQNLIPGLHNIHLQKCA